MDFDALMDRVAAGEEIGVPKFIAHRGLIDNALAAAKYIEHQEGKHVSTAVLQEVSGLSAETIASLRAGRHYAWFELERHGYKFSAWKWRPRPQGDIVHWEACRRNILEERKRYGIDDAKTHRKLMKRMQKMVDEYMTAPKKTRAGNVLRKMYTHSLKRRPIAHTLRFANEVGLVEWAQTPDGYLVPHPISEKAINRRLSAVTKRVACKTKRCANYALKGFKHCGTCKPQNKNKLRPDAVQQLKALEKARKKRSKKRGKKIGE